MTYFESDTSFCTFYRSIVQNSKPITEFVFKLEATVTRAINGQQVSAVSQTFVTSQALNMGFSVSSPVTFYTDMPFETWVNP